MRDADACLILVDGRGLQASQGTALARERARRFGKPLLVVDLNAPDALERAALWLGAQRDAFGAGLALGIGGPRESEAPGIYARAAAFIGTLMERIGC